MQRVYALNALFVVLATRRRSAGAAAARRAPASRSAFFVCGLGATNHTFMAIYAVALGVRRGCDRALGPLRRRRALAGAAGAFAARPAAVSLSAAALARRSAARLGRPRDAGAASSTSSCGATSGSARWLETPADLLPIAARLPRRASRTRSPGSAPRSPWSARRGDRRRWPVAASRCSSCRQPRRDGAARLAQRHLHLAPLLHPVVRRCSRCSPVLGCDALLGALPRRLRCASARHPAVLLVRRLAATSTAAATASPRTSRDAVLESLPPGAHLAATDDNILFVLIYLHFVEGLRPDVDLILQGVGEADLPPLRFDPDTRPALLHPPSELEPRRARHRAGRARVPGAARGAIRCRRRTIPRRPARGRERPARAEGLPDPEPDRAASTTCSASPTRADWRRRARRVRRRGAVAPDNDVLFYNLGLIYARNGLLDEAVAAFAALGRDQPAPPREPEPAARGRPPCRALGGARASRRDRARARRRPVAA